MRDAAKELPFTTAPSCCLITSMPFDVAADDADFDTVAAIGDQFTKAWSYLRC